MRSLRPDAEVRGVTLLHHLLNGSAGAHGCDALGMGQMGIEPFIALRQRLWMRVHMGDVGQIHLARSNQHMLNGNLNLSIQFQIGVMNEDIEALTDRTFDGVFHRHHCELGTPLFHRSNCCREVRYFEEPVITTSKLDGRLFAVRTTRTEKRSCHADTPSSTSMLIFWLLYVGLLKYRHDEYEQPCTKTTITPTTPRTCQEGATTRGESGRTVETLHRRAFAGRRPGTGPKDYRASAAGRTARTLA